MFFILISDHWLQTLPTVRLAEKVLKLFNVFFDYSISPFSAIYLIVHSNKGWFPSFGVQTS